MGRWLTHDLNWMQAGIKPLARNQAAHLRPRVWGELLSGAGRSQGRRFVVDRQVEVDHHKTITRPAASIQVPVRVLYKVAEAVVLLNLSRSQIYELIRSGRLKTVSEGRSRLIPIEAINEYVGLLTREAQTGDHGDAA